MNALFFLENVTVICTWFVAVVVLFISSFVFEEYWIVTKIMVMGIE